MGLRCQESSSITLELLQGSGGDEDTYRLSRPVSQGEFIDMFMSHSWHDSPDEKYTALRAASAEFESRHRREPTLWLDKTCIDQLNIKDGLRVLPVNLMACRSVLLLCGSTYVTRLWCIWELFTMIAFLA